MTTLMKISKNLTDLIKNMSPRLSPGIFVFCTVSARCLATLKLSPILVFREKEGVTIVIFQRDADKSGLKYTGKWALITLNVYSDLQAVGFLAVMTGALADAKISVNAVSAFYHDHLFVPFNKAPKALSVLKNLAKNIF